MKMIEINLLPKNYQKKSFDFSLGKSGIYFMAAAAGIVLLLITVTLFQGYQLSQLENDIEKAQQRASTLEKDIQLVDALINVKQKVHMRMSAVERLDSHRSSWVRILEQISLNVPEYVWLAKFTEERPKAVDPKKAKKSANKKDTEDAAKETAKIDSSQPTVRPAKIEGYAFTLNALASFMIQMMRSDYFDQVELKSTQERELQDKKAYNFVLTCNVHYLSDEEVRKLIATSDLELDFSDATTSHKSLN